MKKIAFFPFAIALLALLGTSCEKELDTTVYGYAKTYGSDTTHAGIEVELYEGSPGGVLGGGGVRLVGYTTTNQNGYYRIDAKLKSKESHYLFCTNAPAKHYSFAWNQKLDFLQIKAGQNKQVNVIFDPYAWLNIHYKNVDPYDVNDRVSFTNNGFQSLTGMYVDTWILKRTAGNRVLVTRYDVVKNSIHETFYDTIGYVAEFDTVNFEVFY